MDRSPESPEALLVECADERLWVCASYVSTERLFHVGSWSFPPLPASSRRRFTSTFPAKKCSMFHRSLYNFACQCRIFLLLMFTLRKPSVKNIRQFILHQDAQRFSYPFVGATQGTPPAGYDVDH